MNNIKPVNALTFTLLVLSIGVYATSQLMPSYAADPTTFFSCEVGGGGCAVRLNSTNLFIINSTETIYVPVNMTFSPNINGGINMTSNGISWHHMQINDCDFSTLHLICIEHTGRTDTSYVMIRGGNITTPQTSILYFGPRIDSVTDFELMSISGDGTNYIINVDEAGTGVLRPLVIRMDGNDILTFNIDNTINFNSRSVTNIGISTFVGAANFNNNAVTNLGAANNDFGVSNTLVTTILTGNFTVTRGSAGSVLFVIEQPTVVGWRNGMSLGSSILKWDASSDALPSPEMQLTNAGGLTVSGGFFSNGPSDFSNNLLSNAGAAGNDLGNPNKLVGTEFSGSISIPSNNTLSLFSDAVRIANIFSVVNTAKTQVTGLLLESDIKAAVGETFNTGDIVCLYKAYSFTKCTKNNDSLVLGPVYLLPNRGIDGHENVTIIERILGLNVSVTQKRDIWKDISFTPMLVVEGPLSVKVCDIVLKGQFLVAGNNGCAVGLDNVSDGVRYFGLAAANSRGGYVEAYMP